MPNTKCKDEKGAEIMTLRCRKEHAAEKRNMLPKKETRIRKKCRHTELKMPRRKCCRRRDTKEKNSQIARSMWRVKNQRGKKDKGAKSRTKEGKKMNVPSEGKKIKMQNKEIKRKKR